MLENNSCILLFQSNKSYLKSFVRLIQSYNGDVIEGGLKVVDSNLLEKTPAAIDWREKGFITALNNQFNCGSCYAFSIAQSIQGQIFKRTGHLLDLR